MIKSKVVMVGSISTGKSALVNRLLHNEFKESVSTTGALYFKKSISLDNSDVMVNIWDTAGQERFKSISKMYYRNANIFILVFDATRPETLRDVRDWTALIRENCIEERYDIILTCNKCDCEGTEQLINEGERMAEEFGFDYQRTSCKTGDGITELFEKAARKSIKLVQPSNDPVKYIEAKKVDVAQPASKKGCC
ncbi:Rab1a [Hexamita inflata]|uniref:Rab1a n=1 Tax=Hexamita inflata TaxID=28002 RepID=A0AA86S2J5_9EUKA|nr:Rab1a [Hexamita inflata]CAI9954508.1 Rab1a [Hexamita inflata]CAI9976895.1 Rab1a [Hexamita inflata]